ncbi:MAG TPA: TlyA family RNA methyltransferase [Vicinamibacterales bacterium]
MTKKSRLDLLIVERGLAASRERARALVLAGQVLVDGGMVDKAGTSVPADARIELATPDHPYVGRGGLKLAHALDVFGVRAEGRTAMDIGASTGGFTDVLLQRGAARVIALDVGRGQIDWKLRTDPRVEVQEGVNARYLRPSDLGNTVDLVTIDVSFISLRLIFPVLPPLLNPGADVIALVKPQFEAGREAVGHGGVVRDPDVHQQVLEDVTAAASQAGFARVGLTPSPITGAHGNQEFLVHLVAQRPSSEAAEADHESTRT